MNYYNTKKWLWFFIVEFPLCLLSLLIPLKWSIKIWQKLYKTNY